MFVSTACLVLIICHYGRSVNVTVEESKCKKLFTYGYGYRQFFHVSKSSVHETEGAMLNMKFWVKARSDAHILLSPSPSPEEADPVYELVLGAGKNSFSDIRRRRRAATKASAYTTDILSGTELKGFWVKINEEGLVMVGREGQDLPFMQWQDPEPLHVEYFSFCTWSGVAGKWLYDCALDPADVTGSATVQPILTARDRLRKALLTNYDVYTSPFSDLTQSLQVNVGVQVNHIQLDSKKSVMSAGCVLSLEWSDNKMIWNPDDFSNLSVINLVHNDIWQPQLVHFNAAGKGVTLQGQEGMRVTSDGMVSWRVRNNLQTRCQLDLHNWPWDTQTCKIQLGFWNQPDNILLTLMENRTKLELHKTSSEWMITRLDSESAILRRLWLDSTTDSSDSMGSDNDTTSALSFTFTLRRANVGVNYVFAIPLLVMMVMSLTCFWMEPLGPEKLAINCLLLLLLCSFLFGLSSNLTAPSHQTPLLLRAYIQVLVVVTCATVGTILITRVAGQPEHEPLPRAVWLILTSHFVTTIFCLPSFYKILIFMYVVSTKRSRGAGLGLLKFTYISILAVCPCFTKKNHNCGQMRERSSSKSLERNDTGLSVFHQQNNPPCPWTLLAVFCDRIAFIAAAAAYTVVLLS